MLHLHHHVSCPGMRMDQRVVDIIDGRIRHALALENIQPLLSGTLPADGFNLFFQLVTMCHPLGIRYELGVSFEIRPSQAITEDAVEAIIPTAE